MPTLVCFGREEEPIDMLLVICLKGKQNPIIMILSVLGIFPMVLTLRLCSYKRLSNNFLTRPFFTTMIRMLIFLFWGFLNLRWQEMLK
ncbi:MAG: hypothetical protein CK551_09695 [Planctomycetaceae bacterium]|nr:MAG: hypothetical protein CK551_09695 [Planctomycetaceae bacterium]